MISVVVAPAVLGKRSRVFDPLLLASQSKLATNPPSTISSFKNYQSLQRVQSEKVLDDRPDSDLIPPVSLLYEGFGDFLDTFCGRQERHHLSQEELSLKRAVNRFAEQMTRIYPDEDSRRTDGLLALNNILSLRGSNNKLMAASIGSVRSDGHFDGPLGSAACVVQFKNELCGSGGIPIVELTSYVAHSHKSAMKNFEEVFRSWRVPCLGLTVVGPCVTFYAVVFVMQWRVIPLTPTLSCVATACEGADRRNLYAAFWGALRLLTCIDQDSHRFINAPRTIENHKFPYISAVPKYRAAKEEIQFQIIQRHPSQSDHRFLYLAETIPAKETILLKFTRRYSLELHHFCAEAGHAPLIIGFRSLPGDWFVIAMEYLPSAVSPHQVIPETFDRFCDRWIDDLQRLTEKFHQKNLVHGDLREPNILCNEAKVMLIDFDWGGKVGEAHYPDLLLCSELTDGRTRIDLMIGQDDDIRVLQNTINELKKNAAPP